MLVKKRLLLIVSAMLGLLLTSDFGFANTVNWKMGFGGAPNDPNHQLIQLFTKKVEEASQGRFKIEIVFTAPLGYGNDAILRFMKQGLSDAGVVLPNYLYKDEPLIGIMLPAGVLIDQKDNDLLFQPMRESLDKIYDKWGVELRAPVIAAIMVDWVLISKEPIHTLEQLKGIKIRHSDKIPLRALNELGIPAQYVPANETYMALKTGVIDGAAYSRLFTLETSLYEVTKYMSEMYPYPIAVVPGIGVSKKSWAKLPANLQATWDAVAKALLWDAMYNAWKAKTYEKQAAQGLLAKGMVELEGFSREDRKTIQQVSLRLWREECEKLGHEAVAHYDRIVPLIPKD